MSNEIRFPSVLQGNQLAYRLSSDWNWENKGHAPISLYLTQYETYGDGLVQHSGEYCTQFGEGFYDACLSLASAILKDPFNPAFGRISTETRPLDQELTAFALSVQHRESKSAWFNIGERKVSTRDALRHDKRWEPVQTWHDGSAKSALNIVLSAFPGVDWLRKVAIACDVREQVGYARWEEFFEPIGKLADVHRDWRQAFDALRFALASVLALDQCKTTLECALHNARPVKAETEQAA